MWHLLALEFREPSVHALKQRVSIRQFKRWCAFNRIHPIDSRARLDEAVGRLSMAVAVIAGAKEVEFPDMLPYRLKRPGKRRADGGEVGKGPALDPEILKVFGKPKNGNR